MASDPSEAPIRVVYVAGAGRSGSTVLDTLLGAHPRAGGFGELNHLPRGGWINDEYCACGRRARSCEFWEAVREGWLERVPDADPEDYDRLQARFTRIRGLPGLARARARRSEAYERYERQTVALYRVLADVAGADVVVDSSKNPARARALRAMPGLDVRVVHLIRDGRAVLWSLKKPYARDDAAGLQREIRPQPTWKVAGFWTVVNLLAESLGRRAGRDGFRRLHYEALVTDPESALGSLGPLMGMDLGELGRRVAAGEAVPVGHTIAGNRLRMSDSVRLRADFSWREQLPAGPRRLFTLLAGWLLWRYGYVPGGRRRADDAGAAGPRPDGASAGAGSDADHTTRKDA